MNRYDCELVRVGQKWRFKRITIDNAWVQGDPEISCRAEALAKEHQRAGRSPGSAREIEAAEITPRMFPCQYVAIIGFELWNRGRIDAATPISYI
jgi:hypothetical protein